MNYVGNGLLARRVVRKVLDLWDKNRSYHKLRTENDTYHNHHNEQYGFVR